MGGPLAYHWKAAPDRWPPARQSITELVLAQWRIADRQAPDRMTDTDDAVRRGGAKPRREPPRPAVEHRGPGRLPQLFAEKLCPIREAVALAQRAAPSFGADRIAGRGTRGQSFLIPGDPRSRDASRSADPFRFIPPAPDRDLLQGWAGISGGLSRRRPLRRASRRWTG
jgi:hypothetical protein